MEKRQKNGTRLSHRLREAGKACSSGVSRQHQENQGAPPRKSWPRSHLKAHYAGDPCAKEPLSLLMAIKPSRLWGRECKTSLPSYTGFFTKEEVPPPSEKAEQGVKVQNPVDSPSPWGPPNHPPLLVTGKHAVLPILCSCPARMSLVIFPRILKIQAFRLQEVLSPRKKNFLKLVIYLFLSWQFYFYFWKMSVFI